MAGIKFAMFSAWINETVNVTKGEAWDAEDPLVLQHPDWFADSPPEIKRSTNRSYTAESALLAAPVEQATAAPGEKRTLRRGQE